eukprot:Skav216996  [mRNA]  locus=scaffold4057:108244:110877:- [translate_table: standard]
MGNGIFLGSFLAPWHVMPVFLDLKLAADPALPGLTQEVLPITSTAIFMGWLVGALCLKPCMETFSKDQLMASFACGLLIVTLATVTLPHLTAGNLVIFVCIRFVYGVLMNITGIQAVHIQEGLLGYENKVSVAVSVGYCVVLVLMSSFCGSLTRDWDWRLETLLWYGLSYSAGRFSDDVYTSVAYLSFADVLGYGAAISAEYWGRTRVQGLSFGLAACCLFLCSGGEPGTPWVMALAMVGRLCLDVTCSTVIVGLVASFSQSAQKTVLPGCHSVELGGTVARGTWTGAGDCVVDHQGSAVEALSDDPW